MQAIETHYNGYRFRSRLEAKWAVFFDEMMIKYEYESEGFVMFSGRNYLPDFYLPDFGIFVEIKPGIKDKIKEWKQNCEEFLDTGKSIMLCIGDPMSATYHSLYGWCEEEGTPFCDNIKCHALFLSNGTDAYIAIDEYERKFRTDNLMNTSDKILQSESAMDKARDQNSEASFGIINSMLASASIAARQARFEHGETPSVLPFN